MKSKFQPRVCPISCRPYPYGRARHFWFLAEIARVNWYRAYHNFRTMRRVAWIGGIGELYGLY